MHTIYIYVKDVLKKINIMKRTKKKISNRENNAVIMIAVGFKNKNSSQLIALVEI